MFITHSPLNARETNLKTHLRFQDIVALLSVSFLFIWNLFSVLQGWYIVTYALGIYHLNLFIAFLSPKVDPSLLDEGTSILWISKLCFRCVKILLLTLQGVCLQHPLLIFLLQMRVQPFQPSRMRSSALLSEDCPNSNSGQFNEALFCCHRFAYFVMTQLFYIALSN